MARPPMGSINRESCDHKQQRMEPGISGSVPDWWRDQLQTIKSDVADQKDSTRETMTLDRSNIVAALLEPADIVLDGFIHKFRAVLSKDASFEETVNYRQDRWHKLNLELQGYEYEILACKKALLNGDIECPEMPHSETLAVMKLMDSIRETWEMTFPCEKSITEYNSI